MEKITTASALKSAIQQLEREQQAEWLLLKTEARDTYEHLKPINLLKNTFKEVITTPDLSANVVNAAIGFTTGFVAKKVFTGGSHNPLIKLLGIVVEIVTTSIVAKNAEGIKVLGGIVLEKITETLAAVQVSKEG